MARAYTVGTVALALTIPAKWVDNILSHHILPGIVQKRQGVARKVSLDSVLQLALTILFVQDLGLPTPHALRLASMVIQTNGNHRTPAGVGIALDLARIRTDLEARLAQAVESAPVPRRGRPPSSKTGRLD